ncbi:uncharacterized protein [Clinocottus analis]|uniref:uncharacterized protein n=1 Tax=Clinocottus analis TaxID=304258 RepID=UPI0035BF685D
MIKLFSVAIFASLFVGCWTQWFDRDNPSGTGDWEILSSLRAANPGKICTTPAAIEAQTLFGLSAAAAGDVIYKSDTTTGFACRNTDQKKKKSCHDYRVRFRCPPSFCDVKVCWTQWFDRDNPSGTGDWETLASLRAANPGKICVKPESIEAVTTDTNTPATSTGDNIYISSPTLGFVCRKKDQKSGQCRDYKVRFRCPWGPGDTALASSSVGVGSCCLGAVGGSEGEALLPAARGDAAAARRAALLPPELPLQVKRPQKASKGRRLEAGAGA